MILHRRKSRMKKKSMLGEKRSLKHRKISRLQPRGKKRRWLSLETMLNRSSSFSMSLHLITSRRNQKRSETSYFQDLRPELNASRKKLSMIEKLIYSSQECSTLRSLK